MLRAGANRTLHDVDEAFDAEVVWACLEQLEDGRWVALDPRRGYVVVTVLDWENYQGDE